MNFNKHSFHEGSHAPFSPSQPSWLNYDDEKAVRVFRNRQAAKRGTRLHAWAKETIDLKIKQSRARNTLSMYVNDAIGFQMETEVVLFYSEYFYGTADAISFRKNFLRIHDLKTGENPADMKQVFVYMALFCLEYGIDPRKLAGMEGRIYQNDEIVIANPTADDIIPIMKHIVHLDELMQNLEEEV